MIKPIKTQKKMSGVYMILELALLLCVTAFVYSSVDLKAIFDKFNYIAGISCGDLLEGLGGCKGLV